jgi:two-component system, sensor histidine kinase and response regulator
MNVLQTEYRLGEGEYRLKILVVEDDELSQQLMRIILGKEGHEVSVASGGKDALRVVGEHRFDIILMDLQMPGMDGVETSRRIRELVGKGNEPYIVALTASYLPEKGRELFESGIDNYLAKPFNIQQLHRIIHYGTGRRNQERVLDPSASKFDAEPANQPVLDHVAGIKMVGGDEGLYRGLLADFARRLPEKIGKFRVYLEERDINGLSRAAHTLKGVSLNLGALQLYEYARKLENCMSERYTPAETLEGSIRALGAAAARFLLKASEFLSI